MTAALRSCAFAAVRRHERGFTYIDRETLGAHPDDATAKAERLGGEPVVRIAAVVVEERREEFHQTMLDVRARAQDVQGGPAQSRRPRQSLRRSGLVTNP